MLKQCFQIFKNMGLCWGMEVSRLLPTDPFWASQCQVVQEEVACPALLLLLLWLRGWNLFSSLQASGWASWVRKELPQELR